MRATDDHHNGGHDIATTYVLDDYADKHGRSIHVYDAINDVIVYGDHRTFALFALRAAINAELGDVRELDEQRPVDGGSDGLRRLRDALNTGGFAGWSNHPVTRGEFLAALDAAIDGSD